MPEHATSRSKSAAFGLLLLVLVQVLVIGVLAFARLGNPKYMPEQLFRLAQSLRNPRIKPEVPNSWVQLCLAWNSWLGVLQREGPRLLRTEELWGPNDPLRQEIANFLATANELRPATLLPEAAAEKDLRVLAEMPSDAVVNGLQFAGVRDRVEQAGQRLRMLTMHLERWSRWDELRALLKLLQDHGFNQTAAALQPRLPRERRDGYRVNTVRTLKLLNDISADEAGMRRLASHWSEFSRFTAALRVSKDPDEQALPGKLLAGLVDQQTLAAFADSLADPIEEMRRLQPVLAVAPVLPVHVPPTPLGRKRTTVVRPLVPVVKP